MKGKSGISFPSVNLSFSSESWDVALRETLILYLQEWQATVGEGSNQLLSAWI